MVLLLTCSGLMSSSETAIFSLQHGERRRLSDQSTALGLLLSRPTRLLITLLLANLVVNVAYFTLSASISLDLAHDFGAALSAGFAVGSLVLMVVLGEILPKTLALVHPVALVRRVAPLLLGLQVLLAPLVALGTWLTRTFEHLLMGAPDGKTSDPDSDDFKTALRGASGAYHAVELALLHDVVDFGERRARNHMVPRVDVTVLDVQDDRETWLRIMARRPYTDYPVVDGSPDNLLGTVNAARLLVDPSRPLDDLLEPAIIAPLGIGAEALVLRLRQERRHLAILLDEYGGMAGVVGLTQLSQGVLGEIEPLSKRRFVERMGDTLVVRGDTPLPALSEELGLQLGSRRADTLGGVLAERLGRVPARGDELQLPGWRARVVGVRRGRVERVVLRASTRHDEAEDAS